MAKLTAGVALEFVSMTTVVLDMAAFAAEDKIIARIEEYYSELYDSDRAVTIQTDPEEVPPIMAWEVEAALRKMKKWERSGKQLAKLYTKCIAERRIPKTWKEANMVIFFQEREQKIHQELTIDQFACYQIIYVQTIHKNHNNQAGEETR